MCELIAETKEKEAVKFEIYGKCLQSAPSQFTNRMSARQEDMISWRQARPKPPFLFLFYQNLFQSCDFNGDLFFLQLHSISFGFSEDDVGQAYPK